MPEHLAALQRGNAATALVPVQPRGALQDPEPLIWAAGPVFVCYPRATVHFGSWMWGRITEPKNGWEES